MSVDKEPQIIEKSEAEVMKEQEAKLRSKFPGIKKGGSSLLQKRLSKGAPKYFDSGDYNMAIAKMGGSKPGKPPVAVPPQKAVATEGDSVTGGEIPTPETVASRKHSLHLQSKLATGTPS